MKSLHMPVVDPFPEKLLNLGCNINNNILKIDYWIYSS